MNHASNAWFSLYNQSRSIRSGFLEVIWKNNGVFISFAAEMEHYIAEAQMIFLTVWNVTAVAKAPNIPGGGDRLNWRTASIVIPIPLH